MPNPPVVLRYKREFLPLSETFIYNQIAAIRRFTAVVVTEELQNQAVFPFPRIEQIRRKHSLLPRFIATRAFTAELGAIARRHDAKLVHTNFGGMGAMLIGPCRRLGLPLITSFHGNDVYNLPREKPGVYNELFRLGDRFICTSGFLRDRLLALGAPPDRTVVHRAGVRLDAFPFAERRPDPAGPIRILAVGRFVPKKGYHHLIAAFHSLAPEWPQIELTLVGYGPELPRLEALAAAGPGAARIHFRRSDRSDQPHTLRDEELARAHLAVVSSSVTPNGAMESLCWFNVEAQACGLPLVATRHNGIPEAVDDGRSAILVPENDPAALAAAIANLLGRPADWPSIGRAGRAFVEANFNITRNTAVLEDLYASLNA